jgi:hypothetical protein
LTRPWRACAAAATLAVATLLGGPASAASAPSALPSSAELQQRVTQQARDLAAGVAAQQTAAARAAAALETYQAAQRAADLSTAAARNEAGLLEAAQLRTAEAERRLAGYVGSLYRTGMGSTHVAMYTSLLDARSPRELFSGLSTATRVGNNHNDAVTELAQAQQAQARLAAQAQLSATASLADRIRAQQAKAAADTVVAEQSRQVAQARAALAATQQSLSTARARDDRIARSMLVARQRSSAPLAAIEGAFADRPVPECQGGRTRGFPNGQLPLSTLCPLWATRGHLLRADAAAAFDEMSKAYGAHYGEPLCVTDSYRSLAEQVAVRAAKPTLAAVPGTSNHGWGVAVDLCGGIQSFGTPQHRWMVENAMSFGWFHPTWAQQGGSLPEPWHWEFAG